MYDWLSKQTEKELAWGVLTGIRPTKIMMNLLEEGKSEQDVIDYMKENYRTTDKKANLGMEIAKREKALLAQLDYKDGYSLYVGISILSNYLQLLLLYLAANSQMERPGRRIFRCLV